MALDPSDERAQDRPTEADGLPVVAQDHDMRAARRRRLWRIAGISLSAALIVISAVVLFNILRTVSWADLRAAFAATSWEQIFAAAGFTLLSYVALTGYDALALRQLALRVPYRITALGSFTSYAISFTLGFPLITGGTVRYWIYSQQGVSAGKVASLTVIAGITFWLGMAIVVGAALVIDPVAVAEVNQLKVWVNTLLGIAILGGVLAYLIWVSIDNRRLQFQGLTLELPGFGVTCGQMILGVIDLCAAAMALFVLLPQGHGTDFISFAASYVFGCIVGIVSHTPGGLGPFEVTMLKAVTAPTQEGVLASLLLFRAVYYVVPFVLALAMLGAHESVRRWASLRAAMSSSSEPK
jgi:uncharacterized membrane protein YbhN (UPF0104 family)